MPQAKTMDATTQFARIFLLLGTFMCLPTLKASSLDSADVMQVLTADAEPQFGSESYLKQLKSISQVIQEARDYLKHTSANDMMKSKRIPFRCDLAPSFGKLNKRIFKDMDYNVKVMIGSTQLMIEKFIRERGIQHLNFDSFLKIMHHNALIQQPTDGVIFRRKTLESSYKGISDGRTQWSMAKRVQSWFKGELLNDADVYESTKINLEDLKNIVSATGAAISSFESFFFVDKTVSRDVVDVGVLRYPEPETPYFLMYRIKLYAYRRTKRILFYEETHSGIGGTFRMHKFEPNDGVIKAIDPTFASRFIESAMNSLLD